MYGCGSEALLWRLILLLRVGWGDCLVLMQEGMVSSRAPIKGAFSSGFAVSNLVTIVEASKAEVLVPNEFKPVFNVLSFELGA